MREQSPLPTVVRPTGGLRGPADLHGQRLAAPGAGHGVAGLLDPTGMDHYLTVVPEVCAPGSGVEGEPR